MILLSLPFEESRAQDLADIVGTVKPSVLGVGSISYARRPAGEFLGTGFVVLTGKHAITNAHVVSSVELKGSSEDPFLAVFVGSGERVEARRAYLIELDPEHDLALIGFEGEPVKPLPLAPEHPVREGELLAFTGFPLGTLLGLYPATHRGIVASIAPIAQPVRNGVGSRETVGIGAPSYDVYQLDATAYPGNSGSPVFRPTDGAVVGVINKVFVRGDRDQARERPSGITYAIPVRHVESLLKNAGLEPKGGLSGR